MFLFWKTLYTNNTFTYVVIKMIETIGEDWIKEDVEVIDVPVRLAVDPATLKVSKIRCMWAPRFACYDKGVSKVKILIDDEGMYRDPKNGNRKEHAVYWNIKREVGVFPPQIHVFATSRAEAAAFAITVAREGRIMDFKFEERKRDENFRYIKLRKVLRILPQ